MWAAAAVLLLPYAVGFQRGSTPRRAARAAPRFASSEDKFERFKNAQREAQQYVGKIDEAPGNLASDRAQRLDGLALADVPFDEEATRGKVKMFGAWLDSGLAGVKASDRKRIVAALEQSREGGPDSEVAGLSDDAKGELFYAEAVERMNKGDYVTSVAMLNRAVQYAGKPTRRGGQMQLWLAQALHASGREGERQKAYELLRALKTHPDRDVRRVAPEILYIYQAPKLKLSDDDYVKFPDMRDMEAFDSRNVWQGGEYVPPGSRPRRDEGPEEGTLEWIEQNYVPIKEDISLDWRGGAVLIAACLGSVFLFQGGT